MKLKKITPYNITISATANNGFITTIGCCTVCHTSIDTLLKDLKEYLTSPEKVEKEYTECDKGFPSTISGGSITTTQIGTTRV